MQTLLRLKKVLRSSALTAFAEQMSGAKFPSYKSRALTADEISQLEKNGNSCEDWSLIQVESPFDANRIRQSIFQGQIKLPTFYGTVLTPGGISVPTGIYRSTIYDSIIENSHIQDVSHLSGVIVSQGAILQNIGSFVTSGLTSYGVGKMIPVGNEMGGRSIRIIPDLNLEMVEELLFNRKDTDGLAACWQQMEAWMLEVQQKMCFVGKGAKLCNTNIVRNSWIGPHARIDGAAKIRNTFLFSTLEHPSEIYDGVILEGVQTQEGIRVHSFAQIRDSLLMRHCKVGRMALVNSSVIGTASHVEEAEVTSSFVGPLTQLHHHSLLISTLWPEGRGNVGYGANVGSNHTGRMPDQELYAGLGQFFGLGTSIKFPANFSDAPFSIIATGVITLPQRVEFPFSLIQQPTVPTPGLSPHLNEIVPGWAYAKNAFAISRNLFKWEQRSKGTGEDLSYALLNPHLARLALNSWNRLQVARVRDFYTDHEIPGLGSNFLRESVRQESANYYTVYLERFAVDTALTILEQAPDVISSSDPADVRRLFQGDLLRELWKQIALPDSLPALVRRHRTLEKRWLESILHGLERDGYRGRKVFDDYEEVHPLPDDLLQWANTRFENTRKRCNHLLKTLREPAAEE